MTATLDTPPPIPPSVPAPRRRPPSRALRVMALATSGVAVLAIDRKSVV